MLKLLDTLQRFKEWQLPIKPGDYARFSKALQTRLDGKAPRVLTYSRK